VAVEKKQKSLRQVTKSWDIQKESQEGFFVDIRQEMEHKQVSVTQGGMGGVYFVVGAPR